MSPAQSATCQLSAEVMSLKSRQNKFLIKSRNPDEPKPRSQLHFSKVVEFFQKILKFQNQLHKFSIFEITEILKITDFLIIIYNATPNTMPPCSQNLPDGLREDCARSAHVREFFLIPGYLPCQ